jgi:FtsZ-binding cell division protein ZapB
MSIEERIAQLESNAKFDATQSAIREREVEFLAQLRQLRDEMMNTTTTSNSNNNGGGPTSSVEIEALKAENAALKAQVAKQQYRIKHLVDAMEEKQIYKAQ